MIDSFFFIPDSKHIQLASNNKGLASKPPTLQKHADAQKNKRFSDWKIKNKMDTITAETERKASNEKSETDRIGIYKISDKDTGYREKTDKNTSPQIKKLTTDIIRLASSIESHAIAKRSSNFQLKRDSWKAVTIAPVVPFNRSTTPFAHSITEETTREYNRHYDTTRKQLMNDHFGRGPTVTINNEGNASNNNNNNGSNKYYPSDHSPIQSGTNSRVSYIGQTQGAACDPSDVACMRCPMRGALTWQWLEGSCYYLSEHASPWAKARDDCRQDGGDLLIARNQREAHIVQQVIQQW